MSDFNLSVSLSNNAILSEHLPLPSFVLYDNFSYARWTFGAYALPEIAIVEPSSCIIITYFLATEAFN